MKVNINNIIILCNLYGKEFDKITKQPCRGKWKGTTDYGLQFKDGSTKFISNGIKYFDEFIQQEIEQLNYFLQNKDALKKQVSKSTGLNVDNFDLVIHNNGLSIGWICIQVDGKNYTETSFTYFCKGKMTWNADIRRTISNNFYLQK